VNAADVRVEPNLEKTRLFLTLTLSPKGEGISFGAP